VGGLNGTEAATSLGVQRGSTQSFDSCDAYQMRAANDGLRFAIELCALAALAYWGFHTADGGVQWLLGLGAPLAMATVWGLFISPKAPRRIQDPIRLFTEIAIFAAAVAALADADRPRLAIVLGAAVAMHLLFTFPLHQR
jgi:hypothetical protein